MACQCVPSLPAVYLAAYFYFLLSFFLSFFFPAFKRETGQWMRLSLSVRWIIVAPPTWRRVANQRPTVFRSFVRPFSTSVRREREREKRRRPVGRKGTRRWRRVQIARLLIDQSVSGFRLKRSLLFSLVLSFLLKSNKSTNEDNSISVSW